MTHDTQRQSVATVKSAADNLDGAADLAASGEDRRLIRARQRAIGRELRRFFDTVAEEPVPDEFLELLNRIGDADGSDGTLRKGS